jgi:ABC-type dipeptide/oligopeptide/nickel transport system permease subunit
VTDSLSYKAWRRLRRNKGAVIGIVIIVLAVLVALFAYVIAPDHSPDANRQIVEIGRRKAGHKQLFFKEPKIQAASSPGFLGRVFNGTPDAHKYIPINKYEWRADSLILDKYVDEGVGQRLAYARKDLPANAESLIITKKFWLGTDLFGRDIASRIIIGVRVSLGVGLIALIISLTIGILLGALAGYYRGWVDEVIMWLINVIWSIPTLLLVFAFTIALGKGFWQVFIAVGLTMWVNVARLVRGQVLKEREMQYVEAAKALGLPNRRIIFRHILPNIFGPIMVIAASNFASAIIIEAGLSFLGIGVQQPKPSWGLMIKENYNFIITNNPMLALAPGFAIMLLVLAFYLLGNGLRDALQVRGRVG